MEVRFLSKKKCMEVSYSSFSRSFYNLYRAILEFNINIVLFPNFIKNSDMAKMKKNVPSTSAYVLSMILCFNIILISWSGVVFGSPENSRRESEITIKIGAILNMETMVGKTMSSCLKMALSDFYDSHAHYNTRLRLYTNDANGDVVQAASAGQSLSLSLLLLLHNFTRKMRTF